MYYLTKEQTGSFEYYGKWVGEQFLYVVYDPDTEYYFRKFIKHTIIHDENFDDELAKVIDGLDFKYGEAFGKALKKYVAGISVYKKTDPGKFPSSSPSKYAAQIPGLKVKVKHPANEYVDTIYDIIISLNDNYKWTREQIADWLETLEENPIIGGTNDIPS